MAFDSSAGAAHGPRFDAGGVASGPLPPSLPDHVRGRIERELIELRLKPGERVSEDGLASRMGLSRTPVREAMRVLEARGLIVRRRGRGTRVADRATADEARALYELRIPLECHLAARAAVLRTDQDIDELVALRTEFDELAGRARSPELLSALVQIDSDFHWTIYNIADTDMVSIIASYWGRLQRELNIWVSRDEPPAPFTGDHGAIIDALRAGDVAAAKSAMEDHIEAGWRALSTGLDVAQNA
jgi:DNA-binding GntR family transcriptional regulator